MPIHARLGRSPLIRRAWFIEKLRLDEWYHYRGPSVSLASARVSLRWILFPSLPFFFPHFFSTSFFSFFFLFQPELATVAFSPLASPFSTPLLVSFSLPLLRGESIKQRCAFIPREDRLTIIEKKLFSPRRGKSIDYACRKKRERGEKKKKKEVRKNDEMYSPCRVISWCVVFQGRCNKPGNYVLGINLFLNRRRNIALATLSLTTPSPWITTQFHHRGRGAIFLSLFFSVPFLFSFLSFFSFSSSHESVPKL